MRSVFGVLSLELGVEDAPQLSLAAHLYHLGYMLVSAVWAISGMVFLHADVVLEGA